MSIRHAIVNGKSIGWRPEKREVLERYLPSNYAIIDELPDGDFVIEGEDDAGWTLEGYVLPRLHSGLIAAEEFRRRPTLAMSGDERVVWIDEREAERAIRELRDLLAAARDYVNADDPLRDQIDDVAGTMNAVGDRVRLIHTPDGYTMLKPGDEGTVTFVDSMGTVHIKWDSGSRLGLLPKVDSWETIGRRKIVDG